jgi:eukaryotic-like serine/threonine-protein kinase
MIVPSMVAAERIGPYRVLHSLGAGGMGEVVLAHDERLDRRVAIKRLHDDRSDTAERRERFRREARILARLNHPAIVQIHDVLHEGGHEYLIMEYVEGRTLREHCEAGPMMLRDLLDLAHQVALGIAAAHDIGIIHRDLKAENVLITRAGRGKLTDFGIAKLDGEDHVTADGAVLGTFRAMSPEQALGQPVDHRSDLFSFGVLLYEALAGVWPFGASTPFLTVHRLVTDEPRPLAELVPGIPQDLARLVHRLLAKDPALRPRDFHEVARALIDLVDAVGEMRCATAAAPRALRLPRGTDRLTEDTIAPRPSRVEAPGVADEHGALDDAATRAAGRALRPAPHASRRRRWYAAAGGASILGVLVVGHAVCTQPSTAPQVSIQRVALLGPTFSDAQAHPEAMLLATTVRSTIEGELGARAGLDLVPSDDVEGYVDGVTRETGHRPWDSAIRTAVGADQILTIQLACSPGSCKVTLTRDPPAPRAPLADSFPLPTEDAGYSRGNVTVYVSMLFPDHPAPDGRLAGTVAAQDRARYLQLVKDYRTGETALSSAAMLAEIEPLRRSAPGSVDVLLFEADLVRHRDLSADERDRMRRATALLGDARGQLPDTYSILAARFDLALAAERLDDAAALLDGLVQLDPDSGATHLQRAKLYRKRGELGAARRELDAAVAREPFSWRALEYRARILVALGDRTAARAAVDQLLARSPGNRSGAALLAHH